jgi:hypothetical protein
MYIHGEFKDVENNLVSVHILTNNDKTEEILIGETDGEILFAEDPIEIETDNDDTFNALLQKSCKIDFLVSDFVGDKVFANNARNIKVNIFKDDECIFAGFAEPTSFNQPYADVYDSFTINCTDAISTLQYYNYNNTTVDSYEYNKANADKKSFRSLLNTMFEELLSLDIVNGTKSKILYDKSRGLSADTVLNVFDNLGISESMFYGDDFKDVVKYDEVLTNIMTYLNLHMIQVGLDYYIFDWNTIKNQRTEWVDLLTGTEYTRAGKNTVLTSELFADNSTNVSMSDVYSQIEVKDELNTIDTVIESPLESSSLYSPFSGKTKYMTEYISQGSGDDANDAMNAILNGRSTGYEEAFEIDYYMQPMLSKNWKIYKDGVNLIDTIFERDSNGTYINPYKIAKYVFDNALTPGIFSFGHVKHQASVQDNAPVSKIDMTSYLYISVNGSETDDDDVTVKPSISDLKNHRLMAEYNGASSGAIYSPADDDTTNYLVFSGKLLLQPIVYESTNFNAKRGNYFVTAKNNGVRKTEGEVAHVPMYEPINIIQARSNLVKGCRYYSRKFLTNQYPKQDSGTYYSNVENLQPWTEDLEAKGYKFKYSAMGTASDKIYKVPVLECEMTIGDKYLVETKYDDTSTDRDTTTFEWLTMEEIKQGYRTLSDGTTEDLSHLKYTDDDGTAKYRHTFTLGFNPAIGDEIIGKEFDIQNNIDYTMNLDIEGTAIPIKRSDALSGKVTFKILGPVNAMWNDVLRIHPTMFRHTKWSDNWHYILSHVQNILIEDFQCTIVTDNSGNSEVTDDKDLVYTSTEDRTYINKKDDITFKFITQLTSDECRQKSVKNSININAVIDMTTGLHVGDIYNATTDESAKAEEHYINQYYTAFCKPRAILDTTFWNKERIDFRDLFTDHLLNKTFFIQSMTEHVSECTVEIKLKEYD